MSAHIKFMTFMLQTKYSLNQLRMRHFQDSSGAYSLLCELLTLFRLTFHGTNFYFGIWRILHVGTFKFLTIMLQ